MIIIGLRYSFWVIGILIMKKAILYVHGKNGCAKEANHYGDLLPDYEVVGLDYKKVTPWEAKEEFIGAYNQLSQHHKVSIIANSIGAYLAMSALAEVDIERAFFISPIVDMEKLIVDMMDWAGVSEEELAMKKEITTSFGETLSWEYLCYIRNHPINWKVPTDILYGENDNLTSLETIYAFASSHNATITIMKKGEHWFHTEKQMQFLDNWLKQFLE